MMIHVHHRDSAFDHGFWSLVWDPPLGMEKGPGEGVDMRESGNRAYLGLETLSLRVNVHNVSRQSICLSSLQVVVLVPDLFTIAVCRRGE